MSLINRRKKGTRACIFGSRRPEWSRNPSSQCPLSASSLLRGRRGASSENRPGAGAQDILKKITMSDCRRNRVREYPCFLESVGSDTAGVYVSLSRVVDPPVAFRDRSLAPRPNWSRWRLVHTVTQCHISQGESESTQAVTTRLLRFTAPEGHILLVLGWVLPSSCAVWWHC